MSCIAELLCNFPTHLVRCFVLLAVALLAGSSQLTAPVYAQSGGGKILFTSNRDYAGGQNISDIYVMNADGSGLVNLTNRSAESDLRPAWSPDGTRIAFQREVDAYNNHDTEIFVMNADGINLRRLTLSGQFDHGPMWSPDGSRIALTSRRDGNFEIYVMDPDGGNNGLGAGTETRATVLRKIAENSVLKRNEQNRAFVLMQYFGYLRRNPDDAPDDNLAGYNFWLNKLNQFSGDFRRAEMVKAFIRSGEYRVRFGEH